MTWRSEVSNTIFIRYRALKAILQPSPSPSHDFPQLQDYRSGSHVFRRIKLSRVDTRSCAPGIAPPFPDTNPSPRLDPLSCHLTPPFERCTHSLRKVYTLPPTQDMLAVCVRCTRFWQNLQFRRKSIGPRSHPPSSLFHAENMLNVCAWIRACKLYSPIGPTLSQSPNIAPPLCDTKFSNSSTPNRFDVCPAVLSRRWELALLPDTCLAPGFAAVLKIMRFLLQGVFYPIFAFPLVPSCHSRYRLGHTISLPSWAYFLLTRVASLARNPVFHDRT